MRRLVLLLLVSLVAVALIAGCAKTQDKVVVRITDTEGKLEPRTITVGYVNERLEAMTPPYIPDIAGDEGKKALLNDVVRKELLVIQALRQGLDKHERQAGIREYYLGRHAEEMLQDELFVKPSEVTQEELEAYYAVRDASFQVLEIAVATKDEADAVYKRVTEGGEDFRKVAQELSIVAHRQGRRHDAHRGVEQVPSPGQGGHQGPGPGRRHAADRPRELACV